MKKISVSLIALMLALVCLASCTAPTEQNASPSKPPVDINDYYFPTLPEAGTYDFGGKTMIVASYHGQAFEQRGDFMRRFTLDLQIEDRFNVKIAYSTNFAQHMNDAIAGNPSADVGFLALHEFPVYIKGGALEPLEGFAENFHLDTNDRVDWEGMEWSTVNGHQYALSIELQELWKYHNVFPMFMNKELLQQRGINPDEIYTLQENKEWTWDKFKEIAKKVTHDMNGDAVPDIYGTTAGGPDCSTHTWLRTVPTTSNAKTEFLRLKLILRVLKF